MTIQTFLKIIILKNTYFIESNIILFKKKITILFLRTKHYHEVWLIIITLTFKTQIRLYIEKIDELN